MNNLLKYFKSNYLLLGQTAVWLFAIVSTFIFEPKLENYDNNSWVNFSRFLITSVVGLSYYFIFRYNLKRFAKMWFVISCIFLVFSVIAYISYRQYYEIKTIIIPSKNIETTSKNNNEFTYVLGNQILDSTYLSTYKNIPLNEVIVKYVPGESIEEKLNYMYKESEIKNNSYKIFYLYTINLMLFSIFIISLMQGIRCQNRKT